MIKQIRMTAGRRGRSRRNTLNLRKYSAKAGENFTEDRNIAERSVCWVDSQHSCKQRGKEGCPQGGEERMLSGRRNSKVM